ncbi:helix-turn-helix domain-containing protein [Vibrio mediterranei]|uniref:helix-turn-helix domain-containing protein n=1 Tax=Vibrio mediterranei TaxID=689 RepID=UPI004068F196
MGSMSSIERFKEQVDAIKNTRVHCESVNLMTSVLNPFRSGCHIYLYRVITGITQKELAAQSKVSWDVIRRSELENLSLKKSTQAKLETHMRKQTNSLKIVRTLRETDAQVWQDWLIELVGTKPKITLVVCSKCKSSNVQFTTTSEKMVMVRTHCLECGHARYSNNLQQMRCQAWRKAESINVYDPNFYQIIRKESFHQFEFGNKHYSLTSNLIHAFRLALDMTQRDLAFEIGLTINVIKRIEVSRRKLDDDITRPFRKMLNKNDEYAKLFQQLYQIPSETLREITQSPSTKRDKQASLNTYLEDL